MASLNGFREYLADNDHRSLLEEARLTGRELVFHLHGHRVVRAGIAANDNYELTLSTLEGQDVALHKTDLKFFYDLEFADRVPSLLKSDSKVRSLGLEPMVSTRGRHFVKNKSLYPLMLDREVLFLTLLEGEVLRGVLDGFNRYELKIRLKGGLPVTVMRHAIYELKNKKGQSFLKSVQQSRKDWKQSWLYVSADRDQKAEDRKE